MIKAIIFDWAGVFAVDGYWIWLRKNISDIENRKKYFQELSDEVDCGKISHGEFLQKLSNELGRDSNQVWQEVKKEIVLNQELITFVKKLKVKYKIGLLSNFTFPWLNEILTENNLWELFDENVISSQHRMIKPDPEIFQKMLEKLNIKPEEAIFIDDRQMHVDGAKRVGINAILFKNNEQLIKDLQKFGVTI